jgi:hypothetical protein
MVGKKTQYTNFAGFCGYQYIHYTKSARVNQSYVKTAKQALHQ